MIKKLFKPLSMIISFETLNYKISYIECHNNNLINVV